MRADERFAIVLLVIVVGCGRSDPPRLKASDLPPGAVRAGVTDTRFQLRNVGGRTLALDGVEPICGCATTSRLPATLAPGAATMVGLRCRAPRGVETAEREIRVRSSDPVEPDAVLSMTLPGAGVGPEPAALYFGYVRVGESVTRDVVLPRPITVEGLPTPADASFGFEPSKASPDAKPGVRVRFTPRRAGIVRTTLDLGPAGGVLPVVAVAHDGVLAFPAEVRTSSVELPTITVVGAGEAPLAITRVEYPPGITGDLKSVVPGRQLRLVLRARGATSGLDAGAIRLLGDAGTPLLTIPVVAGVEAAGPTDAGSAPPAT